MKLSDAKVKFTKEVDGFNDSRRKRISSYTENYKGEYYKIDISKLLPFKNQARKLFKQESLQELASTIERYGIRQPLTVMPSSIYEGKYEIISGERRWRAAELINLDKVPCIIIHGTTHAEEIALIENVQREDLHPIELMKAYQNLLDANVCKSTREVADKIGVNKSKVVEILALNNLPQDTKQELLKYEIKSRNILRALCKAPQIEHKRIIKRYLSSKTDAVKS